MATIRISDKDFENWCLSENKNNELRTLDLKEWFDSILKKHNDAAIIKYLPDFVRATTDEQFAQLLLRPNLSANYPSNGLPLDLSFNHDIFDEKGTASIVSLNKLYIQDQNLVITIKRASIREVIISNNIKEVTFIKCDLGKLTVSSSAVLRLRNCRIGLLEFTGKSVKSLFIEKCIIHSVRCPVPGEENPFLGSVELSDTKFITLEYESKLYQGPQQFRNLRFHLEELENGLEAGKMRSLELAAERRHENSRTNKYFSLYQDAVSEYGQAPARPVRWALYLYLIMVGLVFHFDLAVPEARTPENFFQSGWKSVLLDSSVYGKLSRAFVLPGQYIVSPFGILGAQTLLVSKSGWWNIGLSFVGLLCDFLIATCFLAIRKRFKLN